MLVHVDADAFLAICLEKVHRISYGQMRELQDKIYQLHPGITISICGNDIDSALHYYHRFFLQSGNFIQRTIRVVHSLKMKDGIFPNILTDRLPPEAVEVIRSVRDEYFQEED